MWHHIAFTWDLGATGNWELQVNASLLESGSHLASIMPEDLLSVGASQMEAHGKSKMRTLQTYRFC